VTGRCVLQPSGRPAHSRYMGSIIEGLGKCRVHVTLSILDKHDQIIRQVREYGSTAAPYEHDFTNALPWGTFFTPTMEEEALSVRADGSVRLRAVVRLFLGEIRQPVDGSGYF